MEDGPPSLPLPPPTLEPISRPSSTSTSASVPQLPGISSLASATSATSSPQMRPANAIPQAMFTGSSPAATTGGGGNNPTCQNCQTSTTPLWRRDEFGSVLCNACGLFLKLHNRPRPISLKTDVIKSRNRVKNTGMRPDLAKKKQQQVQPQPYAPPDHMALDAQSVAAAAAQAASRRVSQKSANGHTEGSRSPVSRTGTPSMYRTQNTLPPFSSVQDSTYPVYGSPGRAASPMNGDHRLRDTTPPTLEQLMASNAGLTTRVGELELINKLYHDRVTQLEQELATEKARWQRQAEETTKQLDESHRRENNLKRRLDEIADADARRANAESEPPAKRAKNDSNSQLDEAVKAT